MFGVTIADASWGVGAGGCVFGDGDGHGFSYFSEFPKESRVSFIDAFLPASQRRQMT